MEKTCASNGAKKLLLVLQLAVAVVAVNGRPHGMSFLADDLWSGRRVDRIGRPGDRPDRPLRRRVCRRAVRTRVDCQS